MKFQLDLYTCGPRFDLFTVKFKFKHKYLSCTVTFPLIYYKSGDFSVFFETALWKYSDKKSYDFRFSILGFGIFCYGSKILK